jgi:hypothetical protein
MSRWFNDLLDQFIERQGENNHDYHCHLIPSRIPSAYVRRHDHYASEGRPVMKAIKRSVTETYELAVADLFVAAGIDAKDVSLVDVELGPSYCVGGLPHILLKVKRLAVA